MVDYLFDCIDLRFCIHAHNKWYQSLGLLGLDCGAFAIDGSDLGIDPDCCTSFFVAGKGQRSVPIAIGPH